MSIVISMVVEMTFQDFELSLLADFVAEVI